MRNFDVKGLLDGGYLVQYRNGAYRMVMFETEYGDILVSNEKNTFASLDEYYGNLEHFNDSQYDIVKIYSPKNKYRYGSWDVEKDYDLFWDWNEDELNAPRKMTIQQICDELGYDVEIVG